MTSSQHTTAVQLLTDHQRFVRLVLQRELTGSFGPPELPRSPSLLKSLSPSAYMTNRTGNYYYFFVLILTNFRECLI